MTYLYVIGPHDPGMALPTPPIKIGIATSPNDRIRSIQTGHPLKLTFYALWKFTTEKEARRIEQACHRKFYGNASFGEWFNIQCDDVLRYIMSLGVAGGPHGETSMANKLVLYEPHH